MPKDPPSHLNIAFRADASHDIGVGHLMRCLTLADALKSRGARTRFVCRHIPEHLRALVVSHGHEFNLMPASASMEPLDELPQSRLLGTSQRRDAADAIALLSDAQWDWIVVDHYGIDARWEATLRKIAKKIMVIDDTADRTHDCDLLLDQNLYSNMDTRYVGKVPAACKLLLGPRFALLREEFRQLRASTKPRTGPVKRVLVFFGGVDADNHTGRAIEALAGVGVAVNIDVVIGAQHPQRTRIESRCSELRFDCHVQTSRMASLVAAADFSIGAGGSANWERMCLGLPALVACIADNQRQLVKDCASRGLLIAADSVFENEDALVTRLAQLLADDRLRGSISNACMDIVDGRGVLRVMLAIGCTGIQIREATLNDSASLLMWRNHPSVRNVSRNSEVISQETHTRWLESVHADPNRMLLIGSRGKTSIGVVRFDVSTTEAEVSIYLAPDIDEPGAGSELLQSAERWLQSKRPDITTLLAEVLAGNERSQRMFRGMGYEGLGVKFTKRLR